MKTIATDIHSGLKNSNPIEYKITVNGSVINKYSSANQYTDITDAIAGKINIEATAIDKVENKTINTQENIYIDRIGPNISITRSGTNYVINTEDNESGIYDISYSLYDPDGNFVEEGNNIADHELLSISALFLHGKIKVKAIDKLGNTTEVEKEIEQDPPEIEIKWGNEANTISTGIGIKADITYDAEAEASQKIAQYIWSDSDVQPSDYALWTNYISGNNINIMDISLPSGTNKKYLYLWIRAKNNGFDLFEDYVYVKHKFIRQNIEISLNRGINATGQLIDIHYKDITNESGKTYYNYNYMAALDFYIKPQYNNDDEQYAVKYKMVETTTDDRTTITSKLSSEGWTIFNNPLTNKQPLSVIKNTKTNSSKELQCVNVQAIDEIGNITEINTFRLKIGAPSIKSLTLERFVNGETTTVDVENDNITGTQMYIKSVQIALPNGTNNIKIIVNYTDGFGIEHTSTYNFSNINTSYTINQSTSVFGDWGFYYIKVKYKYDPDGAGIIPQYEWTSTEIKYNRN